MRNQTWTPQDREAARAWPMARAQAAYEAAMAPAVAAYEEEANMASSPGKECCKD